MSLILLNGVKLVCVSREATSPGYELVTYASFMAPDSPW